MTDVFPLLFAFIAFAFVASITPGPNNTMLLISGVNFGFRRSLPHLAGVTLGFVVLLLAVGLGLGKVFEQWPVLLTILRYTCSAYLLYLAWKIAKSNHVEIHDEQASPISFTKAAAFQWANPKAWIMSIAGVSTYSSSDHFMMSVIIMAIIYIFLVAFSGGVWTIFGKWCRRFLTKPVYLQIFNITMAILLVLSLYPILQN